LIHIIGRYIPDIRREYSIVNVVFLILLLAMLVMPILLRLWSGGNEQYINSLLFPGCFVEQHTGHICPSCGLTRSILALYEGDFSKSRFYHPYGFLILLVFSGELILRLLPLIYKNIWIPWFDLSQMILIGWLLKRCIFM